MAQQEQFLQAAQSGDRKYIEAHVGDVNTIVQTAAFICTPSVEIGKKLLDNKIDINAYAIEIIDIWARLQMIEAKKCYVGSWVSGAVNPRSFRDSEDDYISS
jgi:hypothetical protein